MIKVTSKQQQHQNNEQALFNAIVAYMDDDLREIVHAEIAPCSPAEFLWVYAAKAPQEWTEMIMNEFDFTFAPNLLNALLES